MENSLLLQLLSQSSSKTVIIHFTSNIYLHRFVAITKKFKFGSWSLRQQIQRTILSVMLLVLLIMLALVITLCFLITIPANKKAEAIKEEIFITKNAKQLAL